MMRFRGEIFEKLSFSTRHKKTACKIYCPASKILLFGTSYFE